MNHFDDLKDFIFDFMEKNKVESFSVSFDGNGDSGQIEEIDLDDSVLKCAVEEVKIKDGSRYVNGKWEPRWRLAETFEDAIIGFCYEILENHYDGWEINEGSYGTFDFDGKERIVELELNERIINVNTRTNKF